MSKNNVQLLGIVETSEGKLFAEVNHKGREYYIDPTHNFYVQTEDGVFKKVENNKIPNAVQDYAVQGLSRDIMSRAKEEEKSRELNTGLGYLAGIAAVAASFIAAMSVAHAGELYNNLAKEQKKTETLEDQIEKDKYTINELEEKNVELTSHLYDLTKNWEETNKTLIQQLKSHAITEFGKDVEKEFEGVEDPREAVNIYTSLVEQNLNINGTVNLTDLVKEKASELGYTVDGDSITEVLKEIYAQGIQNILDQTDEWNNTWKEKGIAIGKALAYEEAVNYVVNVSEVLELSDALSQDNITALIDTYTERLVKGYEDLINQIKEDMEKIRDNPANELVDRINNGELKDVLGILNSAEVYYGKAVEVRGQDWYNLTDNITNEDYNTLVKYGIDPLVIINNNATELTLKIYDTYGDKEGGALAMYVQGDEKQGLAVQAWAVHQEVYDILKKYVGGEE